MINRKAGAIWNKLKLFTQPGKRLSQRVAFAGAWALALRITARGLSFVRIIVLARILTPEAFGLVAVALLTIELVQRFTSLGFNTALIQRKGDIKDYLDTAWTMVVIRGLVLGGILFVAAPLVADFFNTPTAKPFIQAIAVTMVIDGFTNIGLVYLNKELEIHKQFVWQMSSAVAEFAVSVSAALILRNAWALVYGAIASSIVGLIVSFIIHPYRPRLKLDLAKAKELFGFGMWVLFFAIARYAFTRVDIILVGRFLGVVALGLYDMAHNVGDLIAYEVGNLTDSVAFPAYAKLQDNLPRLRQSFFAGMEAAALVVFPFAAATFVLASDFIPFLLGNQWIPAIPAVRLLVIGAALYALQSMGGSVMYAVGKPRLRVIMIVIASLIMVIPLPLLIDKFGLVGAAIAVLSGNVGGLLFLFLALKRILNFSIKDLLKVFIPTLIVSVLLAIILMLVERALGQISLAKFIIILCVGAGTYGVSAFLLWRFFKSGPVLILNLLRGRNVFS